MKRKLSAAYLVILLVAGVMAAYAGGGYSFKASGGSLDLTDIVGTGLGKVDSSYYLRADAALSGFLECTNNGGNTAPGQKPYVTDIQASAKQIASSNGKVYFEDIHISDQTLIGNATPSQAGCPNDNWTVSGYIHQYMRLSFVMVDAANNQKKNTLATYDCYANPVAKVTTYTCTQI